MFSKPNDVFEWLTRTYSEDPGFKSRLGDRLSLGFRGFPQSFKANARIVPCNLNVATAASIQILSNSSFKHFPFIRLYIVLVTEKVSLKTTNKQIKFIKLI
jgi:hypothetical protein